MSQSTTTADPDEAPTTVTASETDEPAPLIAAARSGIVILTLLATSTTITFGSLFFAWRLESGSTSQCCARVPPAPVCRLRRPSSPQAVHTTLGRFMETRAVLAALDHPHRTHPRRLWEPAVHRLLHRAQRGDRQECELNPPDDRQSRPHLRVAEQ